MPILCLIYLVDFVIGYIWNPIVYYLTCFIRAELKTWDVWLQVISHIFSVIFFNLVIFLNPKMISIWHWWYFIQKLNVLLVLSLKKIFLYWTIFIIDFTLSSDGLTRPPKALFSSWYVLLSSLAPRNTKERAECRLRGENTKFWLGLVSAR